MDELLGPAFRGDKSKLVGLALRDVHRLLYALLALQFSGLSAHIIWRPENGLAFSLVLIGLFVGIGANGLAMRLVIRARKRSGRQ